MTNLNVTDIQQKYIRGISILDLSEEYGVDFEKIQQLVKPIRTKYHIKQILDVYKQAGSCYEASRMFNNTYSPDYIENIVKRNN